MMKRIGVAFPGDPSQKATWSGIPFGLIGGLESRRRRGRCRSGSSPRRCCSRPATQRDRGRLHAPAAETAGRRCSRRAPAARASAGVARLNELGGARRRCGAPAGSTGSSRSAPATRCRGDAPVVTYEDMTIPQTATHPYAGWDLLTRRSFDSRMARQRRAYEQARACCLTSPWAAESVLNDYGIAPQKVHVVGIGCNHARRRRSSGSGATPRFLFVGLDWERKNGSGVLRAFARLRERAARRAPRPRRRPPAALTGGRHRPRRPRGSTSPSSTSASSGSTPRPPASSCPRTREASAIAYVEAATAGLPSIGTSAGGSGYLIGEGGLIVDPADDEALLAAMRGWPTRRPRRGWVRRRKSVRGFSAGRRSRAGC